MALPEHVPEPSESFPDPGPDSNLAAQREHSLMALVELGRTLDLRLGEEELAQLALFNLVGHFGAPHAGVWLRPPGGGPLGVTAVVGVASERAKALAKALDTLPDVWPEGQIVRLFTADWLGEVGDLARRSGLSALARLEGQDDWLGYVALAAPRTKPFYGPVDRELLQASLGIVGAAIENQRLVRDLRLGQQRLSAANERMQELDRVRSEMLQNLNHEFRTPIAVILGAASCLREPGLQDAHRQHFLEMVEKHAAQARDMIAMLLDHAELMSVRATLRTEPVDVGAMLREMIVSRVKASGQRREIEIASMAGSLVAMADPGRLRRVLDELLANALKFSPPESPVSIRAERLPGASGEVVRVEVVDQGRGMTAQQLSAAFEPFRQLDGSTTRTAGGLGIGLTSVRRVLELMGGSVVLESEFGRGTTARIELVAA